MNRARGLIKARRRQDKVADAAGLRALADLVPLDLMTEPDGQRILNSSSMVAVAAGETIYQQGQQDNFANYLLSGDVALHWNDREVRRLKSDHASRVTPIDGPGWKRHTAVARSAVTILRVNRTELQQVLRELNLEAAADRLQVSYLEETADDDWMARLLRSPLFSRFSARTLQTLFSRFEPIRVNAGQVIGRQGQTEGHFHVIESGCAGVSRRPPGGMRSYHLKDIRPGDQFGEASLISGRERETTVTMHTEGRLMRLSATDFDELVLTPLLLPVNRKGAARLVSDGARYFDLKNDVAGQDASFGAVLVRVALRSLDRTRLHVVRGDCAQMSRVAAFTLLSEGIEAVYQDNDLSPTPGRTNNRATRR